MKLPFLPVFTVLLVLVALTAPVSAGDAGAAHLSFNSTAPPGGPSDPAEVGAFLDEVVPAAIARYNVPGATVSVVKDGKLVVARGYGYSDLVNRTPVNADNTLFRIGSISKLFTWTSVMQLVEEGKIDLDADVNTYLKDFKIPDTYPGQPVTMRHLLTHTGGFEDSSHRMSWSSYDDMISIRQYCAENMPARVNPPGSVTSYSNYGTTLAAVIVEGVSGMPFEQYLQSRILDPLGMKNTSISEPLPDDLRVRLTNGYSFTGKENAASDDYIFIIGPAGSIGSTSPDMARFMIAHLENGRYGNATILSPGTAEEMHALAFTNDPRVAGVCLGFYETFYNGRRLIGHGGDTDLFHSELVLIPDEKTGFFVSGSSTGGRGLRNALKTAFMDHYYPAETQAVPEPDPSVSATLQKYAGTYLTNRHNFARYEKYNAYPAETEVIASPDGTLMTVSGGSRTVYVPVADGVFTPADGSRPADGNVVFHTGADGSVEYFEYINVPVMVNSHVPWYATAAFRNNLETAASAVLATVLLWPALLIFRRMYKVPDPSFPRSAVAARWVAGLAALVILIFAFVLLPWVNDNMAVQIAYMQSQAMPWELLTVLALPAIAAALSLGAIALAGLAWKEKYWTAAHRVHYTAVVIALIAMLWWVNFNSLWPWCL
jgi:CubicO group peptidase (beta-lactamase class C family)